MQVCLQGAVILFRQDSLLNGGIWPNLACIALKQEVNKDIRIRLIPYQHTYSGIIPLYDNRMSNVEEVEED